LISHLRLGYISGSIGRLPFDILDVGYGNGAFLSTCGKIIADCKGYDISTYPVPNNCSIVKDIFTEHHDVVTFFDSLEHYEEIYFLHKLNVTMYALVYLGVIILVMNGLLHGNIAGQMNIYGILMINH
jgi:hypothetical protein